MKSHPEYLDNAGAHLLATRIKEYWHAIGYLDVTAWVVTPKNLGLEQGTGPNNRVATFGVRSNLVNGVPPGGWKSP
jgi:hypothetical protein